MAKGKKRLGQVNRKTKETAVELSLDVDGKGEVEIDKWCV